MQQHLKPMSLRVRHLLMAFGLDAKGQQSEEITLRSFVNHGIRSLAKGNREVKYTAARQQTPGTQLGSHLLLLSESASIYSGQLSFPSHQVDNLASSTPTQSAQFNVSL